MSAVVSGKRPRETDCEMKVIMQELLQGWISGTSLQTNEEGTTGQRRKSKVGLPHRPLGRSGAGKIIQIVWIEVRQSDLFYPCIKQR